MKRLYTLVFEPPGSVWDERFSDAEWFLIRPHRSRGGGRVRTAGPALAEACRRVSKSRGQAVKRKRVRSKAFRYYFAIHDERPNPFVWTKVAAEIFTSLETI
jgi:hypothetical protein